jgi:hypothetical protein
MSKFFKKFIALKLVALLLLPINTHLAFALTPTDSAYWNMNRAVSGVTQEALKSRGYVANDPRTYATLSTMSNAATTALSSAAGAASGALAVTLLSATAPAWASIAVMAGVGAVIGYGVNLALNSAVQWIFGDPASSTPITVVGSAPQTPALIAGGAYYSYNNNAIIGATGEAVLHTAISIYFPNTSTREYRCASFQISGQNITCQRQRRDRTSSTAAWGSWTSPITETAYYTATGAAYACFAGFIAQTGSCVAVTMPSTDGAQTLNQAASNLTPVQLAQPLNPVLVAAMSNRLWQQASSQPGYAGIPYSASNPVSTSEAQAWQQVNPQAWPTVGDFVHPRVDYLTNTNTAALPVNPTQIGTAPTTFTTSPNPSVTNPAAASPQINLGSDPAIAPPQLEQIPTAQQILNPVLNLLPGHKNFSSQAYQGQCPTPTIQLYGTHVMNAHCTLIDQNKSIIQAAMTFAWAAIALFIILSA